GEMVTFGFNSNNHFVISQVTIENGKMQFVLENKERKFSEQFTVHIIGKHNAFNATAAILTALEANISLENIKKGLLHFTGTKRRLEYKGKIISGAEFYDDYAHHPTEIQATLHALRQFYPDKKIICIFQPHTYSRTKLLFDDFSSSFSDADAVLIS